MSRAFLVDSLIMKDSVSSTPAEVLSTSLLAGLKLNYPQTPFNTSRHCPAIFNAAAPLISYRHGVIGLPCCQCAMQQTSRQADDHKSVKMPFLPLPLHSFYGTPPSISNSHVPLRHKVQELQSLLRSNKCHNTASNALNTEESHFLFAPDSAASLLAAATAERCGGLSTGLLNRYSNPELTFAPKVNSYALPSYVCDDGRRSQTYGRSGLPTRSVDTTWYRMASSPLTQPCDSTRKAADNASV